MTDFNLMKLQHMRIFQAQVLERILYTINIDGYKLDDSCEECETIKLNPLSNFPAIQ